MPLRGLRFLPFLAVLSGCATTLQPIPAGWLSAPRTSRIRSVVLAADGKVSPSSQPAAMTVPKGTIRLASNAIANGEKVLTAAFPAVDSFDLSESRGEVAFSVKRDADYDIGLVAIEGSDISWIPDDPADEISVQWAPRGNKISYVMRSEFGDIVRTLHIPTAFSFGVDFPFSTVHALGWDPPAERYAVAYSSPVTSDAVDVLKYSGQSRVPAIKPQVTIDANVEPFSGDAIVLQRPDIAYGERLPVVIWVTSDRFTWNDDRAELMRAARVGLVITSKIDDALWQRVRETAWMDASRVFVVNGGAGASQAAEPGRPERPPLHIRADDTVPAGRYRRQGNVVGVAPAVVESFAPRFIAEELKRTSPPNGSQ